MDPILLLHRGRPLQISSPQDSINFAVSEEPDQSDHADVDRESDMVKTYV
jgi:hypothetical protein